MTNPNKARGTTFERAVRMFFLDHEIDAYKPAAQGLADSGDIHGVSPFVVQAKDWHHVTSAINAGLAGAAKQKQVAGELYGAAVVARRDRPVREAYVVLSMEDFVDIIHELRTLPGPE